MSIKITGDNLQHGTSTVATLGTTSFAMASGTLMELTDLHVAGNLTVLGTQTLGDAEADSLAVSGHATFSGELTASMGMYVPDDKKIYFGNDFDASIEYDEDGTDELRFAGAAVTFEQAASFDGAVTLGNATGDTITVTGRLGSDLVPSTDGARDLGTSTLEWKDLYLDGVAYVDELQADQLGAALDANSQAITNINVDSGAIDGVTIGSNSAVTALVVNGGVNIDDGGDGAIDGCVIGENTAAAGTFTALTATGNTVLGNAGSDTVTVTGISTFTGATAITGALNVHGAVSVTSAFEVEGAADFEGNVNIDGATTCAALTTSGNAAVSGTLHVTSNTDLQGTLWVNGNQVNEGNITSDGVITAGTSFTIGSAAMSEADLEKLDGITNGTAAASKAMVLDSNADISGGRNLTTSGAITAGTSFIIGSADLNEADMEKLDGITNGTAAANKALVLDGSKDASGINALGIASMASNWTNAGRTVADAGILTTVDINGGTADNVVIGGATPAAGTFTALTANGNTVLGNAGSDTVTVTGISTFTGATAITGALNVHGAVSVTSAFEVEGAADFEGNVNIDGATTCAALTTSGNAAVTGTLNVTSTAHFDSTVDIEGNLTLSSGADVTAQSFITYSDATLKTDIKPLDSALDKVMSMRGVSYEFKSDNSGHREVGFLAQEMQNTVPEVVYSAGGGTTLGIDYAKLTSVLVEAVKAQQEQINELKLSLEKSNNK